MLRNKAYSFINILGLSIGVACCLLLMLYIQDEYKVDQHHARGEDTYRITTTFENLAHIKTTGSCSPPIAMAMLAEIPEVEVAARLLNPPGVSQNLIRYEEKMFYESDGFIADSSIFSILSYDFISGNPSKALTEPNTVVLTETLAKKIFGDEPALNKIISITQGGPTATCKVTAVVREKGRSHKNPKFFVSMRSAGWASYLDEPGIGNEWSGQNFVPSYLKLVAGHDKKEVIRKMNEVLIKYGSEAMKAKGMSKTLSLEPIQDIYLKSDIDNSPRITYLYVIAAIAAFILLIACINFMNLSTAKAAKRANEIGVRKVMGAFRSSLIGQLLGEALIIVSISIIISIGLTQLALPFFNELTGKTISFGSDNMLSFTLALVGITIVTGLIAGSYPAFYLSSFKPAEVLKGKAKTGNASGWLRQGLVVFQFVIGITLICGVLVIDKQLRFMNSTNLGFNPNEKIVLPLRTDAAQQNIDVLRKELVKLSAVEAAAGTNYIPGTPVFSDFRIYPKGSSIDHGVMHRINFIDKGYLEMMGMTLIAGRHFAESGDSSNYMIINRAGCSELNLAPEEVVGMDMHTINNRGEQTYTVIGVIEDYHQTSLKDKINPLAFFKRNSDQTIDYLVAQVGTHDFKSVIASIEAQWKIINPETPFEFSFLDDTIQQQYAEDKKVSNIITAFAIIAIVISCLGLYGLSTYMAEQRVKEIGVRKVLGASVNQIIGLMSKEFIKLVVIAIVISIPIGMYSMNRWLNNFEYKTSVDILIFVVAGCGALLIALLTVSFESFKAASANPVKALRSE